MTADDAEKQVDAGPGSGSEIAAEHGGEINVSAGDFIGVGDVVGGVAVGGDLTIVQQHIYPSVLEEKLRGRLTRAITVAEALQDLESRRFSESEADLAVKSYSGPYGPAMEYGRSVSSLQGYMLQLRELEPVEAYGDGNSELVVSSEMAGLYDQVNVAIAGLHSDFIGHVRGAAAMPKEARNMARKIARRDLKSMALIHADATESLWQELDLPLLTDDNFDVLGDAAIGAIKVLTEMERRKRAIAKIGWQDRLRDNYTVAAVLVYIGLVVGLFAWLIWRISTLPIEEQLAFETLELPLIGIPAAVITWSLIGSFAAMLIRFNREPVYNFGYTVKWLLTRPVQGVILGAAVYIVLVSGLFVLTGDAAPVSGDGPTGEIVLVISFLVGFSDRFADTVFDSLLQRFSKPEREEAEDSTASVLEEVLPE